MSFISPLSMLKFAKARFIECRPFILVHSITYKCNLRCIMCNFWKKCKENELDLNETSQMLYNAKNAGFFIYHITGGEPLLVKDIRKILKIAKSFGFLTYVNTNGILLKKRAKEIASFIDLISVSIDGSEKIHNKIRGSKNAYKRTIEGIKEAKKNGIKIKIISTIGVDNIEEMENVAKLAKKLNVSLIYQPRDISNKDETFIENFREKLYKIRKKYDIINSIEEIEYFKKYKLGCSFPKVFMLVLPTGRIGSCLGYCFGNVKTTTFKKIFNSKKFKLSVNKAKNCKDFCGRACVTGTNILYNLNLVKVINTLKKGLV